VNRIQNDNSHYYADLPNFTFIQRIFCSLLILIASSFSPIWAAPAKVALIHSNPVLGDVPTNISVLESLVEEAFDSGANIIVTPELATTGFSITQNQVLTDLGFTDPYPELDSIRDLAITNQGYVIVAIAEVAAAQKVYNTVAVYGPTGLITTSRKRGLSGWHERGDVPIDIITTPYGDIAYIICSDSYLPDWLRIATLKGADLLLLPANWWGSFGQEEIWQTRARENGVWFFTANRWGTEVDERFGFPFTYYMDDAPSTFITPNGKIELIHRAESDPVPANKILYYDVDVPQYRIGTTDNPVYSVNFRKPEAYSEIANLYYRPDLDNQPAPGLPTAGVTQAASMAYKPSLFASVNLAKIQNTWAQNAGNADVLVLPGFGLTAFPINSSNPAWHTYGSWAQLQQFVEQNGLELLVTSALEFQSYNSNLRQSLVILRPNQAPELRGQIHSAIVGEGTGVAPTVIDLPNARVGVLLGRDALFPETATHLAKSGIDLLLVTSAVGANDTLDNVDAPNYFWDVDALLRMWKTRTNHVFHLAASDWTGNGAVIENTYGIIGRLEITDASTALKVLDVDSNTVRTKFLNAYYSFDLESLLESQ